MKKTFLLSGILSLAALQFCLVPAVYGQQGGHPVFELRKFHVMQPKSPVYDANGKSFNYTTNAQNWLQVVCEYRATDAEGWLDNVTFKWNVHLIGAETDRLVLTRTIIYDKVEADGKATQRGVVYLSPRDIRRYYSKRNGSISTSKVVVYVEILVDGIKVGQFQFPKTPARGLPPQWWTSRQVNRQENVLLSRTESPWSDMDHDTWVPERPSEKPVAK